MKAAVFATGHSHLGDEIGTGDEVAELGELFGKDRTVVEVLGLAEDKVEAVESTSKAEVAADDTDIVAHNLLKFFLSLGDEDHLLVEDEAVGVPVGDSGADVDGVDATDGGESGIVSIDDSLEERVAGKAVATMEARAGALASSIEPTDAAFALDIDSDAAALIMGGRTDRYHIAGDVDTQFETFGIDGGEAIDESVLTDGAGVEEEMFGARYFHLVVDSACYYVARGERETRVVLVHKLLALDIFEDSASAAHSLGDEESRFLGGVIERGRMELDELHILKHSARAVYHSDTVASRDDGSSGSRIDVAHAASGEEGHLGEIGVDLVCDTVEGIDAVALDAGGMFGDPFAEVVLGDDIDSELIFFQDDIRVVVDSLKEAAFYFGAGIILMVKDAELAMAALTVEVEAAVLSHVEIDAILNELGDTFWGLADSHFNDLTVTDAIASDKGVGDMLLEAVALIHHSSNTPLCIFGRALGSHRLRKDANFTIGGHLESETQAGDARTDDKKIDFVTHKEYFFAKIQRKD